MRHKVYGKHLGRNTDQRKRLFHSLVRSLILAEKLEITQTKAKAIKGLVDRLINQAKAPATRHLVSQFLSDAQAVERLVKDLLPRLSTRRSGYTSVIKLGPRLGDGTMMVQMRLLLEESRVKRQESSKREIKTRKLTRQNKQGGVVRT